MSESVPENPRRRAFLRGVIGTVGVGAVAAAGLGTAGPANADPHVHCEYTSSKLTRLYCLCNTWMEQWTYSCKGCGYYCSTVTRITGIYCSGG
jgi:hypothetical protein